MRYNVYIMGDDLINGIRLNKYLSQFSAVSRRKADDLIASGKVQVNGVVATLGMRVDAEKDEVLVEGKKIGVTPTEPVYFAVYKPQGYVSTTTDRFGEQIVTSLVPSSERLYPVGRLDKDSEGLMILTNDGDFAYKMTHPKYEAAKTYQVLVKGRISEEVLSKLRNGVELDDGETAKCEVKRLRIEEGGHEWLEFVLHEGRKRQIRRMCAVVHLYVEKLIRVQMGSVSLGDLTEGKYRSLKREEVVI
jgi:23S rRNA pseudouridine2605 synthase